MFDVFCRVQLQLGLSCTAEILAINTILKIQYLTKFALSFKEALQFWALVNKLTRCLLGNFASWFSLLLIFLSSSFTLKDFLNRFMCHTVCTQIRLDMSSVLIWVQFVL